MFRVSRRFPAVTNKTGQRFRRGSVETRVFFRALYLKVFRHVLSRLLTIRARTFRDVFLYRVRACTARGP